MTKLNKAFSVVRALQTSSKFLLGAFIISISSFIYVALAAPPDSPYNLGETLAPTCAPGDANCTVDTPQEGHNYLTDIAGIVANQGDIIYFNGIDWVDLGVGTSGQFLKTQGASANPVWDSIGGGGDLLSANNLSDLDDAGIARTNLGLAIGTDVQAYNNNLNDIAILTPTSDYLMIGDGTDWTTVNTANWDKDNTDDLDINSLTVESTIADTDTLAIYDTSASAIRKITRANFLSGVTGALTYQGSWNASTNSPTLADGTGTQGQYYVVTTAGSRDLGSGSISFTIGDWIIHNGSEWEKLDSTNDVQSVFGRTGIITSANGDYSASQITNTAAGTISATTIQDAINELDSEKQGIDAQLTDIAGLTPTDSYFIVGNGSNFVTESGTTLRTSIGLGDVENTALSTWAGTSNVTTLGTIATGTWQGTSINATYLDGQSGTNTGDETVASIGSLINGATGKITPVDADYVGLMDSAASNVLKKLSWSNVKATLKTYFDTLYQTALTFGISDNNAVEIDSNSVADDEYARFTANGLESRSTAELLADINPMTAAGDIIYGGTSGLQTRLPKGTANQVLTMNAGATAPEWATSTSSEYSDGGENGGADRTLGNKDNYDLGFLTNNINRLHIQNDGNIGIGTNAPSIDLAIGDTDTGLEQVSDGVLTIKTNNDERVRFDASGNVGIGTNEPNSALEVIVADDTTPHGIANINNSLLINTNGNSVDSGASISLGCALGGYDKPTATIKAGATGGNAGYLDFMTASSTGSFPTTKMTILADGKVGVGVTDPSIDLAIGDTDTGIDWHSDGKIGLKANNTEKLRITSSGVSIGAIDPTMDLTIGDNDTGIDWINDGALDFKANGGTLMQINQDGVGIGGDPIDTFKLGVTGNISTDYIYLRGWTGAGATAVCRAPSGLIGSCSSIEKYKKDIIPIPNGLDLVENLTPRIFTWKDNELKSYGFIAEEVEKVDPKLVEYYKGELTGVKYAEMSAVLTKAIQELKTELDEKNSEIGLLKTELCVRDNSYSWCKNN